MTDKIEEVTEILEKWFKVPIDVSCAYCEAAKEIDQSIIQPAIKQAKQEQAAFDQLNFDKERREFWVRIEEAKQAGRKEVVEWIDKYSNYPEWYSDEANGFKIFLA